MLFESPNTLTHFQVGMPFTGKKAHFSTKVLLFRHDLIYACHEHMTNTLRNRLTDQCIFITPTHP